MVEWKEYKVAEVIEEISMGPFGSNIKVDNFIDSGVPVLNGSNLQGFKLNEDSFNYVSQEKADSLGKANAHKGDVVITHRGTLGQIVYIPEESKYNQYVISQSQFRLKLNQDIIRPDFFVYFFHTRLGQHRILMNASQVGVPALARPTSTFKEVLVPVPSMDAQIKIMDMCKFPYRIGLSGTIPVTKYADGLTLVSNFGPVLVDIKAKQLQEEGYISNCKITQVRLDYTSDKQKNAFKEAKKNLVKVGKGKDMYQLENKFVNESERRFYIITKLISGAKQNTMVLFKDRDYGKKIFKWLKENTNKMIYYIDGDIDKKVREEIRKRMEIKDDVVLVASFGTSSTGISINKIFNIFFVSSYKSISTVLQSIGRGLRKSEKINKDFVNIYDISDDLYSGCYEMAHARERIKIYEGQGFPYEVKKLKM